MQYGVKEKMDQHKMIEQHNGWSSTKHEAA
jgi:hypothetical protein